MAVQLGKTIDFRVVRRFFDRDAVIRQMDRKRLRAMSQIGAFIRRKGRNLTRAKKSTGSRYPAAKSPEPNLRTILFALGDDNKSLVVGSVRLRTPYSVPFLMEHGGTIRDGGRPKRYRPRPYMGPALEQEVRNPKLMQAWETLK